MRLPIFQKEEGQAEVMLVTQPDLKASSPKTAKEQPLSFKFVPP